MPMRFLVFFPMLVVFLRFVVDQRSIRKKFWPVPAIRGFAAALRQPRDDRNVGKGKTAIPLLHLGTLLKLGYTNSQL